MMPDQVRRIVREFELLDFSHCSLTMLDAPLLIAFIKRWHKETSLFHLSFGKMTITLDDVSSLFHLPIDDKFWTTRVLSPSLACMTVARDLGVYEEVVQKKFAFNRGIHLCMSWLRKTYNELVKAVSYEVAARVYMLHLIACTFFTNKAGAYIDTRYMCLLCSLKVTSWA